MELSLDDEILLKWINLKMMNEVAHEEKREGGWKEETVIIVSRRGKGKLESFQKIETQEAVARAMH